MKRNTREHGRILSVETMRRGSALAADAAAAATSITVDDAGDFDEDGGWLYIGAQVVEFTACNDDTGVLTLATGLTALAEQGDSVHVYDPLYGEVVDYQVALVVLDGEHDNTDPVEAEVAEGVEDLPEGDRGKAGESCTLLRIGADEWELIGVGGRPRKSRGIRFEADDTYVLTAGDITAASASIPLTHRPVVEGLTAVLASIPQRPTNYTINYAARTLTMPLSGWEKSGDRVWVHYPYRKRVATALVPPDSWAASVTAVASWAWYRLAGDMTDASGNARNASATAWGAPTWGRPSLLPSDAGNGAGAMVGGSGIITPAFPLTTAGATVTFGYKGTAVGAAGYSGYFFWQSAGVQLGKTVGGNLAIQGFDTGLPISVVADNVPHLIVTTFAPGSRVIEVDGTVVWSDATSPTAATGQVFWGYGAGSNLYRLEGDYDEAVLVDRPLTADERALLKEGWFG